MEWQLLPSKTSRAKPGMGQIFVEVRPTESKVPDFDITQLFLGLVSQETINRYWEVDFRAIGIGDANLSLLINGSNTDRKISNRTHSHKLKWRFQKSRISCR